MAKCTLFEGGHFTDDRGSLHFFNNFSLEEVVRMYAIEHLSTTIIRAWQGHKKEKKWFYCTRGSFIVNLIKLDNFDAPSKSLKPERFLLEATNPSILEISGGYTSGLKALQDNSKLLVFSNFDLTASQQDDFRYPVDNWSVTW